MKKSLKILGVVAVTILIIVAIAPVLAKPIFIQIKFCDSPAVYESYGVPHELLDAQYQHGNDLEYRDFVTYNARCSRPEHFQVNDIVVSDTGDGALLGRIIEVRGDEYVIRTRDGEVIVGHFSIIAKD